MVSGMKYHVVRDKHTPNNRAHLSPDGRESFCNTRLDNQGWQFMIDQPATAEEFVEKVRGRCASCLRSAKTIVSMNKYLEWMKDAQR